MIVLIIKENNLGMNSMEIVLIIFFKILKLANVWYVLIFIKISIDLCISF